MLPFNEAKITVSARVWSAEGFGGSKLISQNRNRDRYARITTVSLLKEDPYEPKRPSDKRKLKTGFNSFYTDELFHRHMLDESIRYFKGVGSALSLLLLFYGKS